MRDTRAVPAGSCSSSCWARRKERGVSSEDPRGRRLQTETQTAAALTLNTHTHTHTHTHSILSDSVGQFTDEDCCKLSTSWELTLWSRSVHVDERYWFSLSKVLLFAFSAVLTQWRGCCELSQLLSPCQIWWLHSSYQMHLVTVFF